MNGANYVKVELQQNMQIYNHKSSDKWLMMASFRSAWLLKRITTLWGKQELFAVRPRRITERFLATKHSDKKNKAVLVCFSGIVLAWVKKSPLVSLAVSTKKLIQENLVR